MNNQTLLACRRAVTPLLMALALGTAAGSVHADIYVIAHPSVKQEKLTQEEVERLWLGKARELPAGETVEPLDLVEEGGAGYARFAEDVLGKPIPVLRTYWSKRIFTGKGNPPRTVTATEMVRLVRHSPVMLGYVEADAPPAGVKVLYRQP